MDISESEGSLIDKISEVPDVDERVATGFQIASEESHSSTQNITEEVSEILTNVNYEMPIQKINENGEDSDLEIETKISLDEISTDKKSGSSEISDTVIDICLNSNEDVSQVPFIEQDMSHLQECGQKFDNMSESGHDKDNFFQPRQKAKSLNDLIDEAIDKQINAESSSISPCDSGLNSEGDEEFKEVSVQTSRDQIVLGDSCPMCKLHKEDLKGINALPFEYPPNRKRKNLDSDSSSGSISEIIYDNLDNDLEGIENDLLKRNLICSNDQIVPISVNKETVISSKESSSRPIRLGLSKRAKIQPLHKVPKFPAADTTQTDP